MAARTTPPFRADHVGTLLRPPELLQAAKTSRTTASAPPCRRGRGDRDVVPATTMLAENYTGLPWRL